MEPQIRNFCIIAHVDHGKSTLADRLLELTGSIKKGQASQVLDKHPISRERGITIKLAPVTMKYKLTSRTYLLNLVDTPGHIDFSYEVERTLAAVEGAILLVDASQGVQAQTVNYWRKARKLNLAFIPVINKIDLDSAKVDEVKLEMMELFGFKEEEILLISAKTGQNVPALLKQIIEKIPPPDVSNPETKALIFDSFYDQHRGVIAGVRLMSGSFKENDKIVFYHSRAGGIIRELGIFKVDSLQPQKKLTVGQLGYVVTGLKNIQQVRVGDTLSLADFSGRPISGFKKPTPLVFASFYPTDPDQFSKLKEAVQKLSLIDASLSWRLEQSTVLGSGIRLGFLGVLHSQITKERLEMDYDLSLIATMPSISYRFQKKGSSQWLVVNSAASLPESHQIKEIQEPFIEFTLFSQKQFYGRLMELIVSARAKVTQIKYFGSRLELQGLMPLAELISVFYNRLEEATSGFVSFDWSWFGWQPTDSKKVELLLNGKPVQGLVFLFPKEKAFYQAQSLVEKLKKIIPRQQFEVIIQAKVTGKIVARKRIPPFRKDVTAKLYGGDQTRKDKLLKKQKQGKKKMKYVGKIQIPQAVFSDLFKD